MPPAGAEHATREQARGGRGAQQAVGEGYAPMQHADAVLRALRAAREVGGAALGGGALGAEVVRLLAQLIDAVQRAVQHIAAV